MAKATTHKDSAVLTQVLQPVAVDPSEIVRAATKTPQVKQAAEKLLLTF